MPRTGRRVDLEDTTLSPKIDFYSMPGMPRTELRVGSEGAALSPK
jgi:hypothetical protein